MSKIRKFRSFISEELSEEGGAGEFGTSKLANKYKNETPGQISDGVVDQVVNRKKYQKAVQAYVAHMKKNPPQKKQGKDSLSIAFDFFKTHGLEPKFMINYVNKLVKKGAVPKQFSLEGYTEEEIEEAKSKSSFYKSPAHSRLQKHMNKIRKTSSYKSKVQALGGTPKKPTNEETCCEDCDKYFDHELCEAEYKGREVTLNDPFRAPSGDKKKFYVYVKNEKGNVIKLGFGDPNMEIKRDDPARRKSFRARHNCDNPGPKYKARYWSCYQWRAGAKVDN